MRNTEHTPLPFRSPLNLLQFTFPINFFKIEFLKTHMANHHNSIIDSFMGKNREKLENISNSYFSNREPNAVISEHQQVVKLMLLIVILIAVILAKSYCRYCDKNVFPIMNDHCCISMFKDMKRKIRNYLLLQISEEVNKIENYLDELTNIESINDYEKEILRDNLISLRIFEILPDYKYTLIAMGSILEFLLIRHCERNRIEPEDYRDPSGSQILAKQKKFVNYVQSAIKTNLFKRKNSWHIIQHNLRNFRNYVHIKQETKDERIDKEWYRTIKPHFERILNDFISQD